jgi:peptidoglycan/xylan/chitin deacetylase (PgdA/CDA1 family)
MLTFRHTNIAFILLLSGLLLADFFYIPIAWYFYLLLVFVYSLVVFYGCINIQSNFFMPVVCSSGSMQKEIAISFDDGPVEQYTPELLSILEQHEIEAAFFCIGNRIEGNEMLLKQVDDAGQVIGNHSHSHHFWFDMYSSRKMMEDLAMMDAALEKAIGKKPKLFRPPYGVMNPNLKKAITEGGYKPVGWNVRSLDTVVKEDKKLLDRILPGIKPGAVFLFHDTSKTTLNILPIFIEEVKKRGFRITRLDKMLHLQPYA